MLLEYPDAHHHINSFSHTSFKLGTIVLSVNQLRCTHIVPQSVGIDRDRADWENFACLLLKLQPLWESAVFVPRQHIPTGGPAPSGVDPPECLHIPWAPLHLSPRSTSPPFSVPRNFGRSGKCGGWNPPHALGLNWDQIEELMLWRSCDHPCTVGVLSFRSNLYTGNLFTFVVVISYWYKRFTCFGSGFDCDWFLLNLHIYVTLDLQIFHRS